MFEDADNFADIFRNLPYYLLLALPILMLCSNPVLGSELAVNRLSQFDSNGIQFGCQKSAISFEAKSLYSWSTGRHCVVAKLEELSLEQFREIRAKAGGLIILLPRDILEISQHQREHLNALELEMLSQASSIPIYFSVYNEELEKIIADITRTTGKMQGHRDSAIAELFNAVSANGYQVVVTGGSNAANKNSKIAIIQGELTPAKYSKQMENGLESNLPLIVVTAHLKTFGIYNEYPQNADTAILMSIAELFGKLYASASTSPNYRLMFLLTESGSLLNFQGAKRWLDDTQLQNLDFVLCLDTIVKAIGVDDSDESIYMHVSKPPKDGSAVNKFYRQLKTIAAKYRNTTVEGIHKRINLGDQQLAWEHERFSIKRLSAFTLSSIKSPKDPLRITIFKDSEQRILQKTQQSAKIIAETLARYVFNIDEDDDGDIFAGAAAITSKLVKSYMNMKSTQLNNDLRNAFEKHLKNVKLVYDKPDAREPDFMFYDGPEATLNVYSVKPAVFDLLLTIFISVYLVCIYFVVQYFPRFYDIVCTFSKAPAVVANGNYTHGPNERSKAKTN